MNTNSHAFNFRNNIEEQGGSTLDRNILIVVAAGRVQCKKVVWVKRENIWILDEIKNKLVLWFLIFIYFCLKFYQGLILKSKNTEYCSTVLNNRRLN